MELAFEAFGNLGCIILKVFIMFCLPGPGEIEACSSTKLRPAIVIPLR